VSPGNFFAIGLNYKAHAKETGTKPPELPVVFNKSVHCIVGPNDNIIIPKNSQKLDHEVEIAIVIGKKAKRVSEKDAQNYLLGYCICNDISEREWQKEKGGQWVKGKSGDTFGPIGPYLVTKDEIRDPFNLKLTLDLNGKRRQTGNTSLMIFNFNFLIAHLSSFMTLMPGDIITTGTPPGVGLGMNPPQFLQDGDEMILKVDNLGEQKLKVIREK
jgi:2-keto-4-pentenoate hydratase/2-oxohepta-3-ene-1,7-dioic acid hydratase in catechol pathway